MDTKLIIDRLQAATKQFGIPAWGVAVLKQHRQLLLHTHGMRDAAQTIPAAADDRYWLYSLTKLSTCTAAMQLMEQGLLQLDTPVGDLLPAFARLSVRENGWLRPAATPLRVIDLMTMRGGYDYDTSMLEGRSGSNAEFIDRIAQKPLCFDPGTHFQYSLCHDVLAGVVAAASGMPYADYLQRKVFAPLGMTKTGFYARHTDIPQFSAQYRMQQDGTVALCEQDNNYVFSPQYTSGGAGLVSTLTDYSRLVDALANGGMGANGTRILREDTVRLMATDRLSKAQYTEFTHTRYGYGYGLGVRVRRLDDSNPGKYVEFGWDGAAGAYAMCDLSNRLAVVYVQHVRNCMPAYDVIHPLLRDSVYEAMGL